MRELDRLGDEMSIDIPIDGDGYLGRECPDTNCKGYFKITPGTGLENSTEFYCPYCGYRGDTSNFTTEDQIEYALSVAKRRILDAFRKDLRKAVEFNSRPKRGEIGLSLKVEPGRSTPLHYYVEEDLETTVDCDACALRYMVYGVFAYCPDCGQHNSIQILEKDFEVILKLLDLASTQENTIQEKLVEDALENCISAFDGFGRNLCRAHASKSKNPDKVNKISFQNIVVARESVRNQFCIDISSNLNADKWQFVNKCFQKRHVFAHNAGVIDIDYIRKSGDTGATVGRKLSISSDEVQQLVPLLKQIAADLSAGLGSAT